MSDNKSDLCSRLAVVVENWQSVVPGYMRDIAIEAKAEIERLQAAKRASLAIADERSKENVELRAALKPFANAAGAWDGEPPELWVEFAAYDAKPSPGACVADFRAARQAVQ